VTASPADKSMTWKSTQLATEVAAIERRAAGRLESEAERILDDMDKRGVGEAARQFQRRTGQAEHAPRRRSKRTSKKRRSGSLGLSVQSSSSDDESVDTVHSLAVDETGRGGRSLKADNGDRGTGRVNHVGRRMRSSPVLLPMPSDSPPQRLLGSSHADGDDSLRKKSHSFELPPSAHELSPQRSPPRLSLAGSSKGGILRISVPGRRSPHSSVDADQPKPVSGRKASSRRPSGATALVRYAEPTATESFNAANSVDSATPNSPASSMSYKPKTFLQSMGIGAQMTADSSERSLIRATVDKRRHSVAARTFRKLETAGLLNASSSGVREPPPELRVEWRAMKGSRLELMLPPNPPDRKLGGIRAGTAGHSHRIKDTSVRAPDGVAARLGQLTKAMEGHEQPAGEFLLPSTKFAADAGINTLRVQEMDEKQRELWLDEAFGMSSSQLRAVRQQRLTRPPIKLGALRSEQGKPVTVRYGDWAVPPKQWRHAKTATSPRCEEPSVAEGEGPSSKTLLMTEAEAVALQMSTVDAPFLFRAFCKKNAARLRDQVDEIIIERRRREGDDRWSLARLRQARAVTLKALAPDADPDVPHALLGLPAVKPVITRRVQPRRMMRRQSSAVALALSAANREVANIQ